MANDPQRAKARAIFGPGFFENSKAQPDPKNAAVALQKRANARPIPTYKVGGQVKKADQDFSKPLREALTKAAMKGTPAMKDGGPSDEFTAKRVAARMKAGNYKDGGKVDDRLKRKKEDIESDYRKALAKGKDADVAKAKYDQRMADAADDYAKWTKADRTQTKAAEAAAEKNLTNVRRYGAPKKAEQDKVTVTRAAAAPADTSAASSVIKASAPSLNAKLGTVSAAKPASKPTVRSAPKPVVRSAKRVADKVAAPAATPQKVTAQQTGSQQATKSGSGNLAKDAAVAVTAGPSAVAGVRAADASARRAATNKPMSSADYRAQRAAELEAKAAKARQLESAPTGTSGAAWARLKNAVGFGSSGMMSQAKGLRNQNAAQETITAGRQKADAARAQQQAARKADMLKRASAERSAGREANAKYYEREASYLKKGGEVGKYAAGGAGKVRKGMMKGK